MREPCLPNRRKFLSQTGKTVLGGSALLTSARTVPGGEPAAARRPNIIFILADDLGRGDVGCYGQKLIQTPNIDRLALEGMLFTQCYSGSPVCAPSRCSLMTGMHQGHARIRGNASSLSKTPEGRVPLLPEDVTIAEVLKEAGYATGIVGKWGLGEPDTDGIPNKQGFDYWYGFLNQNHAEEYWTDYLWRNQEKVTIQANTGGRKGQYTQDLFVREGLEFIRREKDKPFFLYLAFTIPHAKHVVPSFEPYVNKPWPETQKTYAAMITRMDRGIGEVMALLKELGLDDITIVFFSSDNGAAVSGGDWAMFQSLGPFRGKKATVYEGGIRVPMIARWPGKIKPNAVSDEAWAFWDFAPTAAEIGGTKMPTPIDGISMLPTLLGQPQKGHECLYWEFQTKDGWAQAVRVGDWKAIRFGLKEPLELYDLKNDIAESNNVAAQHPDIVARVEKYLETARVESSLWPSRDRKKARKESTKKNKKA